MIVRVSYILGVLSLLTFIVSGILGVTCSLVGIITGFIGVITIKSKKAVFALLLNLAVFFVIISTYVFVVKSFTSID